MSSAAEFLNLIRRECQQMIAALVKMPRHGIVTSYNPGNATVRVSFPEDLDRNGDPKQSGWIPWAAGSAGNGWTVMFAPQIGMQATVHYSGGISNSAFASGALHSESQPPPAGGVPAGEFWAQHASGTALKLTHDGTAYIGSTTGTFQRVATEQFVLDVYNVHTHPNGDPNTGAPNQQVPGDSTTYLTAQLKAT